VIAQNNTINLWTALGTKAMANNYTATQVYSNSWVQFLDHKISS
jgi:hypothetical protein